MVFLFFTEGKDLITFFHLCQWHTHTDGKNTSAVKSNPSGENQSTWDADFDSLLEEASCIKELNSLDNSSAVARDAFRSLFMVWTVKNTHSYNGVLEKI